MFQHSQRLSILTLLLALVLGACSRSDDGPMDLSDGEEITGNGFYLSGSLAQGRRVQISGDTLLVELDSLWSVSSCFLDSLVPEWEKSNDTLLTLGFSVRLRSQGDALCASPLFQPDTVLRLPLPEEWSAIRAIVLVGTPRAQVYPDTVTRPTTSVYNTGLLDTVQVRRGSLASDTIYFYMDSLFDKPSAWPRRTPGDTTLMRRLDSLKVTLYPWRALEATCPEVRDECPLKSDTLWPSWSSVKDTQRVVIRPVCLDTARTYCAANSYHTDTTSLGPVLYYADTTWHSSLYYLEKSAPCAAVNLWGALGGTAKAGHSVSLVRELFLPAADEPDCSLAGAYGWNILSIAKDQLVKDTTLARKLLDEAQAAGIAHTLR